MKIGALDMGINYKQCSKCGSKNSLRIIDGMPGPELFQEADAGKVKLGGCCIIEGAPEYFCNDCKYEWNREQAIDGAYSKIKTVKASVGGYFGGYYNVEIDLVNLKTIWSHRGGGEAESTVHKTIRKSTVVKFIEQIKMADLLNWKAKYIEPGVCDGAQWSVEIIIDRSAIKKHGDNKFPDNWEIFCKAVARSTSKIFE